MNKCLQTSTLCRLLLPYEKTPLCLLRFSGVRHLYAPGALGIDGYVQIRERIKLQFDSMGDRFRVKMKEFVAPNSVNMVFTEDLKQMVHLANANEEDLNLIEEMMVKFNNQSRDVRFGSFVFGPVVMRMYHHLNKPKEALQVFLNPDLNHFFDQIASFQILMDLLFKNEMYDEVLQVANIVREKQLPDARFPKNVVVLAMAAAYKKNTPESMEYMKNLWSALQESGHLPMRRAVTFAAALAINQNSPHIALELISVIPTQKYVTVRNLRVSALADINRPDDALPILRGVLEIDAPQEVKHTFCEEVIAKIRSAVEKSNNKEVQQEFQRIHDQLSQLGHINDSTIDSVLCAEIDKVTEPQRRDQRMLSARFDRNYNRQRGYQRTNRPGLQEIE